MLSAGQKGLTGEKVCSFLERLKSCLGLVSNKTGKNYMGSALDLSELISVHAGEAEN